MHKLLIAATLTIPLMGCSEEFKFVCQNQVRLTEFKFTDNKLYVTNTTSSGETTLEDFDVLKTTTDNMTKYEADIHGVENVWMIRDDTLYEVNGSKIKKAYGCQSYK